jgi:hypothetical protein
MEICPIHSLILRQTFSFEEIEFLVCHENEYNICESCRLILRTAIRERIARDCYPLPDRKTGPAPTNLPGKTK